MKIQVNQNPSKEDSKKVSQGLQSHNKKTIGNIATDDELSFSVFAHDESNNLIAGLRAIAIWDWLNIEAIWVDKKQRDKGLGSQLLKKAEDFAKENNVFSSCLETTSFQAKEFYEKQGYEVFGKLDDFPIGHTMFYMKKNLGK